MNHSIMKTLLFSMVTLNDTIVKQYLAKGEKGQKTTKNPLQNLSTLYTYKYGNVFIRQANENHYLTH